MVGDVPLFGRDPAQVERELGRWAAGFEEKAQRFGRMRQRVEEISVTETTADGAVRVTVAANGNLTDLELSDRVYNYEPGQLSQVILACMRRAQSRLADRVEEAMRAAVDDDDRLIDQVVAGYRGRFPDQPDDPRRAP